MTLAIESLPVPLVARPDGAILVQGTRVPLDTVVAVFDEGATPEEIVSQFPTLQLADVYAIVAYYMHHQAEVQEYLEQRQALGEEIRRQHQARFPTAGLRERLLARHARQQAQ